MGRGVTRSDGNVENREGKREKDAISCRPSISLSRKRLTRRG